MAAKNSIVREREVVGGAQTRDIQGGQRGKVVGDVMGDIVRWRRLRDGDFDALWDEYYAEALLRRVRMRRTPMGMRNSLYILLALAVPMLMSFISASQNPFLPALQSYIFGFICGMNMAIYLWARQLPDQ